jgi:hypothetical protein
MYDGTVGRHQIGLTRLWATPRGGNGNGINEFATSPTHQYTKGPSALRRDQRGSALTIPKQGAIATDRTPCHTKAAKGPVPTMDTNVLPKDTRDPL